jgi:galactokinase
MCLSTGGNFMEVKTWETSIDRLFEIDEFGKEYIYKNYSAKLDTFADAAKYLKEKFNFEALSDFESEYFLEIVEDFRHEKWQKKIQARERRKAKKLQK